MSSDRTAQANETLDAITRQVREWPARRRRSEDPVALLGQLATFVQRVGPIAELHTDFAEAHADGASSNDIAQLLDDWLVAQGLPTVLYA